MLKKETVKELKNILKEDYGKELSMPEATEAANALVGCFDLLAKVYHQSKIKKKNKGKKVDLNI